MFEIGIHEIPQFPFSLWEITRKKLIYFFLGNRPQMQQRMTSYAMLMLAIYGTHIHENLKSGPPSKCKEYSSEVYWVSLSQKIPNDIITHLDVLKD
jgi:hypothetical protein